LLSGLAVLLGHLAFIFLDVPLLFGMLALILSQLPTLLRVLSVPFSIHRGYLLDTGIPYSG
jgi:hypothetical protein